MSTYVDIKIPDNSLVGVSLSQPVPYSATVDTSAADALLYYTVFAKNFIKRVTDAGGTIEDTTCFLTKLQEVNPTAPANTNGVLDQAGLKFANLAMSLEHINKNYYGPSIKAAKISGLNTVLQDIYFDDGKLDTAALLTFANGGDVFVHTWYDQSIYGNHSEQEEYGNELVTNGGFDTDSGWTKGIGWTISGNDASCDGTQTSTSQLRTSVGLSIQNTLVKFSFEVKNYSAGTLTASIEGTGSNEFTGINKNGIYTVNVISTDSTPRIDFTASSDFIGSIDNVSVKEALSLMPYIVESGSYLGYIKNRTTASNQVLNSKFSFVNTKNFYSFIVERVTGSAVSGGTSSNSSFYGVAQSGSSDSPHDTIPSFSSVAYYDNGTLINSATRNDIYTAAVNDFALITTTAVSGVDLKMRLGYAINSFNNIQYKEVVVYNDQTITQGNAEANIITRYNLS